MRRDRSPSRTPSRFLTPALATPPRRLALFALGLVVLVPIAGSADTIYLKDGTQILECKVTSETAAAVSVRTKVGDMVVPREKIQLIQRTKTVHDTFAEERTRVRDDDVKGLYRLASWCRSTGELREESDQLLTRVLELNENHAGAHQMLGHVRASDGWIVPPPLAVQVRTSGVNGKAATDFSQQLELFLRTRPDVRLVSALDRIDPLDACTMSVAVAVGRKAGTSFYGEKIGRDSVAASLTFQVASPWAGKYPPKVLVAGEVPAGAIDRSAIAIQNALGTNGLSLHKFFDNVIALRAKNIALALREKAKADAKEARDAKKGANATRS